MSEKIRGIGFIDFENINIAARNQHGVKYLDFGKLAELILRDFTRVGCKIYIPHEMRQLIPSIQKQGLETIQVSPGKSVDGRLIFDLIVSAQNDDFDVAVIASGDRDYIPVVEHVKRINKDVRIATFSANLAPGLKAVVGDNILALENYIDVITKTTNSYKCSNCGVDFKLPFKLFDNQLPPLCPKCYKQRPRTNQKSNIQPTQGT